MPGYFAGELARVAFFSGVEFAIGAKCIAPLWRLLDGLTEQDWTDAIDMTDAQVAIADARTVICVSDVSRFHTSPMCSASHFRWPSVGGGAVRRGVRRPVNVPR